MATANKALERKWCFIKCHLAANSQISSQRKGRSDDQLQLLDE